MNKKTTIIAIFIVITAGFVFGPAAPAYAIKKAELVEAIPSNAGLTKANARKELNAKTTGADWDYKVFGPGDAHFKTMNKAELIEAIASDAGLIKADARRALDAFIGATTKSLRSGNRVALVGFGSFSISKRKARTGRNPQAVVNSGLELVKFKAGDRPFLPNVEYITKEDIATEIVSLTLTGSVSKAQGLTEDQAGQFIDSFTNVILDTLQAGIAVNVGEDFGTFWTPPIGHVDHGKSISKRKARTGRNPQTGATIQIPAKRVIKFKAGADLAKTVA